MDVDAASGKLKEIYERVRPRAGVVSNIAKVQSLRPKTMERGFDLYCQIMDDLVTFSKAAELSNFSGAAKALRLSQAAVSQRV